MNKAFEKHLAAIRAGTVTKTNVIGIRKALNARARHWRAKCEAAPTESQFAELFELFDGIKPESTYARVTGELHDSGLAILQSKRYRKALESVAEIVADIQYFTLRGFDEHENQTYHAVYRAHDSRGRSFPFKVTPWQAGGNGPEIQSSNYW